MSTRFPKTNTGLTDVTDVNLVDAYASGTLRGLPGSKASLENFSGVQSDILENANGPLILNDITAEAPLHDEREKGVASLSLLHDETLQVLDDGRLGVDRAAAVKTVAPIQNHQPEGISLKIDPKTLQVVQGALTLTTQLSSIGALPTEKALFPAPFKSEVDLEESTTTIDLALDETLQVTDGGELAVSDAYQKEMAAADLAGTKKYEAPLKETPDSDVTKPAHVGLELGKGLKLDDDDKLRTNVGEDLKVFGALSTGGIAAMGLDEALSYGFSSLADLTDNVPDEDVTFLRLKANKDDFSQKSGELVMKSKGNQQIPYYSVTDGLNTRSTFKFNDTLSELSVPHVVLNSNFNPSGTEAVTASYVGQYIQGKTNGGIDVSAESNGRRELSIRKDVSLAIDQNQNLQVNPSALSSPTVRVVDGKFASGLTFQPGNGGLKLENQNQVKLAPVVANAITFDGNNTFGEKLTGSKGIARTENDFHLNLSSKNSQILVDNETGTIEGNVEVKANSGLLLNQNIIDLDKSALIDGNTLQIHNGKITGNIYHFGDHFSVDSQLNGTNTVTTDLKPYTSGSDNVHINNNAISVDKPEAVEYTAGSNITISNRTISAQVPEQKTYSAGAGLSMFGSTFTNALSISAGLGITVVGSATTGYVISSQSLKKKRNDNDDTEETDDTDETQETDLSVENPETISITGLLTSIIPLALVPIVLAILPIIGTVIIGPTLIPGGLVSLLGGLLGIAGATGIFASVWGYERERKKKKNADGTVQTDADGNPVYDLDGDGNYQFEPGRNVAIISNKDTRDTRLLFDSRPLRECYPFDAMNYKMSWEFETDISRPWTIAIVSELIQPLTAKLALHDVKFLSYQSILDGLTTRVATTETNVTALQSGLATTNTTATALAGRVGTTETNVTALQSGLATTNTTATALAGRVGTTETGLATTNSNLTSVTNRVTTAENAATSLTTRVGTAEGAATALTGRVTSAESAATSLTTRVGTTETNLSSTNTNLTSVTNRVTSAENAAGTLTGRVTSAENAATTLTTRVTSAENAATSLTSRVGTTETNLSSTNTNLTSVTNRVSSAESAATALTSRVSTNESNLTSVTGRVTSAENAATSLTTRVGTTETNLGTTNTNLTSVTNRVSSAEGAATALTTRVSSAETAATALTSRVGTNETNHTNLSGRVTTAENNITGLSTSKQDVVTAGTNIVKTGVTLSLNPTISATSLTLSQGTSPIVFSNNSIFGNPTSPSRSNGTKIVFYPDTIGDYSIGVQAGAFWNMVPTTTQSHRWYGGSTLAMTLTGLGDLSVVRKINNEHGLLSVNDVTASGSLAIVKTNGTAAISLNTDSTLMTSSGTLKVSPNQPQITSVGTLTNLLVAGNISNVNGQLSVNDISASGSLAIVKTNGTAAISLTTDATLSVTSNQLKVSNILPQVTLVGQLTTLKVVGISNLVDVVSRNNNITGTLSTNSLYNGFVTSDSALRNFPETILPYPSSVGQTTTHIITGDPREAGIYFCSQSSAPNGAYDGNSLFNVISEPNPTSTFSTEHEYVYSNIIQNPANVSGNYYGFKSTLASGVAYAGEWIQIQYPFAYTLKNWTSTPAAANLKSGVILGSNDGVSWTLLYTISSEPDWFSPATFPVNAITSFSYFRMVCTSVSNQQEYWNGSTQYLQGVRDYVLVKNTVDSTSSVTGGLQIAGGVGVAKNLFVGQNLSTTGLSSNTFSLGTGTFSGSVTGTNIVLSDTLTTNNLISSSASFSGSVTGTNIVLSGNLTTAGQVIYNSTSDSSSLTTGSLQTKGGVSITKNLFVGGTTVLTSTADSTSKTTGAVQVAGGLGINKSLWVGGQIIIPNGAFGAPTISARSNGAKVVLWPDSSVGLGDYAIGINNNMMWSQIPAAIANQYHSWFAGTNPLMHLSGTGTLVLPSTTDSTSSSTGALQIAGGVSISKALFVGKSIMLPTGTFALPKIGTTRSIGAKVVLYSDSTATTGDYALGINNNTLWYQIPSALASQTHAWYAGDIRVMDVNGLGTFTTNVVVQNKPHFFNYIQQIPQTIAANASVIMTYQNGAAPQYDVTFPSTTYRTGLGGWYRFTVNVALTCQQQAFGATINIIQIRLNNSLMGAQLQQFVIPLTTSSNTYSLSTSFICYCPADTDLSITITPSVPISTVATSSTANPSYGSTCFSGELVSVPSG